MNETSLSLLDRVRQSADSESWDRLVRLYAPLMKHWLGRYEIQDSDIDDLVQEVLTTVVTELPKFEHNQRAGAFRSWLRTILVNRVRNFWRSRKQRPIATGTSSLDEQLNQLQDDTSELSQIWNREHDEYLIKRLMQDVQGKFESKTWKAFHRQVVDGQKADVVAQELGDSLASVYMAKSRVLSALRRESKGLIDKI